MAVWLEGNSDTYLKILVHNDGIMISINLIFYIYEKPFLKATYSVIVLY